MNKFNFYLILSLMFGTTAIITYWMITIILIPLFKANFLINSIIFIILGGSLIFVIKASIFIENKNEERNWRLNELDYQDRKAKRKS